MLKNVTKLESTVGDKVGHLYLDSDTPIESAKAMIFDFLKTIGQIEDNIKAQQAAAKVAEAPAEQPVEVPAEQPA